jgi:hypothetical protein
MKMRLDTDVVVTPPTKVPFIIWMCRDGLYRLVCARVAQGTADFVIEKCDGTDAMGQQRWEMISVAPQDNPLITTMAYDFLDMVCPKWRELT